MLVPKLVSVIICQAAWNICLLRFILSAGAKFRSLGNCNFNVVNCITVTKANAVYNRRSLVFVLCVITGHTGSCVFFINNAVRRIRSCTGCPIAVNAAFRG